MASESKALDLSKTKAALATARGTVKDLVDQCVKDRNFGKGSPLKDLATLDQWLAETETKLEAVGKPRVKREKKAKK